MTVSNLNDVTAYCTINSNFSPNKVVLFLEKFDNLERIMTWELFIRVTVIVIQYLHCNVLYFIVYKKNQKICYRLTNN